MQGQGKCLYQHIPKLGINQLSDVPKKNFVSITNSLSKGSKFVGNKLKAKFYIWFVQEKSA
jgi:hypothetical protein